MSDPAAVLTDEGHAVTDADLGRVVGGSCADVAAFSGHLGGVRRAVEDTGNDGFGTLTVIDSNGGRGVRPVVRAFARGEES